MPTGQSDGDTRNVPSPTTDNNPKNVYRSYNKPSIYDGGPMYNSDRTKHERLSNVAMIARANGGSPSDTSQVGHYVSDDLH